MNDSVSTNRMWCCDGTSCTAMVASRAAAYEGWVMNGNKQTFCPACQHKMNWEAVYRDGKRG